MPDRDPCAERLDALAWSFTGSYVAGGVEVGIRSTSPEFGRWIDAAFEALRRPSTGEPAMYSAIVTDDRLPGAARNLHSLYRGCTLLARSDRLEPLARALVADVESLSFPHRADAVFVEAAVVGLADVRGLVPAGVVSALRALGSRAARAGLLVPSSLRSAINLESGQVVIPHPTLPIRPEGPFGAADEPISAGPVELVGVWSGRSEPGGTPSRGAAVHRLAAAAMNLSVVGGDGVRAIARLVSGARPFGFRPAEPSVLLTALMEALGRRPEGYAADRREVTHRGR